IDASYPIVWIADDDRERIAPIVQAAAGGSRILEFHEGLGTVGPKGEVLSGGDLSALLQEFARADTVAPTLLLLWGIEASLRFPENQALLRMIGRKILERPGYDLTVLIGGEDPPLLEALRPWSVRLDLPPSSEGEVCRWIASFAEAQSMEIEGEVVEELVRSLAGFSRLEVERFLRLTYQRGGTIAREDLPFLEGEKVARIEEEGFLVRVANPPDLSAIGGMRLLKTFLHRKAVLFRNIEEAVASGIVPPRGVLIAGMPGCGKSTVAQAVGPLFRLPLFRLDIEAFLDIARSRPVERLFRIIEAAAPCVLWIDEIERLFLPPPVGERASCIARWFRFLSEPSVHRFVVATVNAPWDLPAHGWDDRCFDEAFFIDLPHVEERRKIFEIHLRKRGRLHPDLDLLSLAEATEGVSGAGIEALVTETIERAFLEGRQRIGTEDLHFTLAHCAAARHMPAVDAEAFRKR
ncbi:MAG: AAA family ATPase, partial [Deltaproteobacteria bacterium]